MKKAFYFAAALLAVAACSKNEVVEMNRGEAIGFRTVVNGNTKATDKLVWATNDVFNVWATYGNGGTPRNYFKQDYKFNGTDWRSTATPYYWPSIVDGTSNKMVFDAIYPSTIGASRSAANSFSYTVVDAAADQVDVLFATHTSTSKETSGVTLNFGHTLSQIVIKTKNSSSSLKFDVSGVKVAYVNKAGTFTNTNDPKWTSTDATAVSSVYSQELTSATVAASASAATLGASWILMPQTQSKASAYASVDGSMNGAYLAVKMVVKNATDDTVIASGEEGAPIWCCFPIAINWVPGYKYTYTIDLAGGGYFETDKDSNVDLDPVLDNQEIFFVDCTITAWTESSIDVEAPETPVTPAP